MQETIVAEMRAKRLDLDARAKFSEPGEEIQESRQVFYDLLYPDAASQREFRQKVTRSAKTLEIAAAAGQFDVG